jgi:hypothetical protein
VCLCQLAISDGYCYLEIQMHELLPASEMPFSYQYTRMNAAITFARTRIAGSRPAYINTDVRANLNGVVPSAREYLCQFAISDGYCYLEIQMNELFTASEMPFSWQYTRMDAALTFAVH